MDWKFWKKGREKETEEEIRERTIKATETKLKNQRYRLLNERLRRLQRKAEEQEMEEEIRDMEDYLNGDDDENNTNGESFTGNPITDALVQAYMPILLNKVQNQNSTSNNASMTVPQTSTPMTVSMTDEALLELKNKLPNKVLKELKTMDDTTKAQLIRLHLPNIDEDTLKRAVVMAS